MYVFVCKTNYVYMQHLSFFVYQQQLNFKLYNKKKKYKMLCCLDELNNFRANNKLKILFVKFYILSAAAAKH